MGESVVGDCVVGEIVVGGIVRGETVVGGAVIVGRQRLSAAARQTRNNVEYPEPR